MLPKYNIKHFKSWLLTFESDCVAYFDVTRRTLVIQPDLDESYYETHLNNDDVLPETALVMTLRYSFD